MSLRRQLTRPVAWIPLLGLVLIGAVLAVVLEGQSLREMPVVLKGLSLRDMPVVLKGQSLRDMPVVLEGQSLRDMLVGA